MAKRIIEQSIYWQTEQKWDIYNMGKFLMFKDTFSEIIIIIGN